MPSETIDFEPEEEIAFEPEPEPEAKESQAALALPDRYWPTVAPRIPKAEPFLGRAVTAARDSAPVEALLGRRGGEPMKGEAASRIDRFGLIPGMFMPSEKVNTRTLRVGPQDSLPVQLAGGAYNATLNVADVLASPGSVLTFGAGAALAQAPSILKLMSGAFGVDMTLGALQQVPAAQEAYKRGDMQGAAEAATGALLTGAMAAGAATHALSRTRPVPATGGFEAEMKLAPTEPAKIDFKPAQTEPAARPPAPPVEPPAELEGHVARRVPTGEIVSRPDVMQFKQQDDVRTGENKRDAITGKWDPYKGGNLLLWEPLDKAKYGLGPAERYIVANGHHRVAKAKRDAVADLGAQIIRESDGWSEAAARTKAAEINIADGKGTIYDQAKFFRNLAATHGKDAALAQGRSLGERAGKATSIAFSASDSTWDAFINERISPDHAEAIALVAPENDAVQRVGIGAALKGKSPQDSANIARVAAMDQKTSAPGGGGGEQIDIFGRDDAAIRAMEDQAARASRIQAEYTENIRAILGAARKPEVAARYGIDIKNPAALEAKLAHLRAERARWENWHLHPDLVDIVRGKAPPPDYTAPPPLSGGAAGGELELGEPAPGATSGGESIQAEPATQALPAGTTPVTGGTRFPVAMNRAAAGTGRISIPEIFGYYSRVMRTVGSPTPIRWGRMGKAARTARGIFKPRAEVIRLNSADNITTAAHEIAHAIDHRMFRKAGTPLHTSTPPNVRAELVAMGRALYGSRKPNAGYTSEGFSELLRHWLTLDDARTVAPHATQWLENVVFAGKPGFAEAMQAAKRATDLWREQGSYERAMAQMAPPSSWLASKLQSVRETLSTKGFVEEATPLERIGEAHRELTGAKLPVTQDPFAIYTAKRGATPKVLQTMVNDGMLDIWGRATGGESLKNALAPIKPGEAEQFAVYLWARRAIERWGRPEPVNPGMSLADAQHNRALLENPRFARAAQGYYKWWDGILDYVAEASPANAELVDRIRQHSHEYVPLPRQIPEALARAGEAGRGGGGLHKMEGSGLGIRNIYESTLKVASGLIDKAHRDLVTETVFEAANTPGMGSLVEKVPKDQVPNNVSIDKIKSQLEAMGLDLTGVPADAFVSYFTDAHKPKGWDSVMVRKTVGGETDWYQVNPEIAEVLSETPPAQLKKYSHAIGEIFAGSNRLFKLGTTGLRVPFAIFNGLRDLQTLLVQSHFTGRPDKILAAYMGAWGENLKGLFQEVGLGKGSETLKMLNDLGTPMANFNAGDIRTLRRESRHLFRGRLFRRAMSPVETLRDLIGSVENAPRLAELKLGLDHFGWKPGEPITAEQALQLAIATKRVTTDFTARGGSGTYRALQRYSPFFGAAVQGLRGTARTFKRDRLVGPERSRAKLALQMSMAGGMITAWTMANWNRNKDKDWYRGLPWRERYLNTHVEMPNGVIVKVPRPHEWGNMFQVIPEALMDTLHQRDPEFAKQAFNHLFLTTVPGSAPPLLTAAGEQFANKRFFFDRNIVPANLVGRPPGEQRGPYTSLPAAALGDLAPNTISPQRVDALAQQLGGGLATDILSLPGAVRDLASDKPGREPEPADWPIVGRLFRRGGGYSQNNQFIADFFDDYSFIGMRSRSKTHPLTAKEKAYWHALQPAHEQIKDLLDRANKDPNLESRQARYRTAARRAERITEMGKRLKVR